VDLVDIRNDALVIGMADLLMDTELDEHQRELVDTVRSSSDALLALINDILDFSTIESGQLQIKREPFALHETVESCLDLVAATAAAKDVELICAIESSCPPRALGDPARLRQILINLLCNAVKFTDRGQVLLSVSAAEVDQRLRLTCEVQDTGIGISADGIPRLFTSFSQIDGGSAGSHGGTGLGLAISQRLAHAMGGQIRVESVAEIGSTFTLDLLLDPIAAEPREARLVSASGHASGSALLVEDNATSRQVLERQLTGLGMTCTTAGSATEALKLVRNGLDYDVALVDMTLPGPDGLQLGSLLRAHRAAPLILLTAGLIRPSGAEEVFTAFVTKPVKGSLLAGALTAALHAAPDAEPSGASAKPVLVTTDCPLRVLLAEDNPVNQRVAQLMMSRLGHGVDIVGDGGAAVTAARLTHYDVVLMDVQMPRMDGLAATREIRQVLAAEDQPYIIAMTANAMVEDRDACTAAGMDSYLTKPFRVQELRAALSGAHPRSSRTEANGGVITRYAGEAATG